MLKEKSVINAELFIGAQSIPVEVRYKSRYSILVRFENGISFKTGSEFDKIILTLDEEKIELGKCRLFVEPNINRFSGHLTFVKDIYNCESLLSKKKIIKLQSVFDNLPLILSYKNKIDAAFKDYTANLNYDLNVYKNIFDNLDKEYFEEPIEVKKAIQNTIIETEGRNFLDFLWAKMRELENLVLGFNKRQHESHGFYFRKQLWNIILISKIMRRTNLKPRGYAGDSEMMRLIYLNDAQGHSTFSKLMHLFPMEQPGAQAVRNRRKFIVEQLRSVKKNFSDKEKLKVLSVACGPAFELQDIFTAPQDFKKYHFTLLDQDQAALYEAAAIIDMVEKRMHSNVEVDYLTESVRTMITTREISKKWGQFHFIYSLGLFDYLTPPVAKAVLAKLYQILKPGGELIVGNFHTENKSRIFMEYWLDWVLYYRDEEDFLDLVNQDWGSQNSVLLEDTGTQMFLKIDKPE